MSQDTNVNSEEFNELEWVAIRENAGLGPARLPETTREKFIRKAKDNPLVPIGCTATVCALGYGLYNFYKGRGQMSQYMMRARVIAQGFTFVAIITGIALTAKKKN